MPFYVTLYKLTDQGRKTIKDSPKRARAVVRANEKAGVKVHQILYTTGRYDLVLVTEAPNDKVQMTTALAIASAGNVSGETLHAYTIDQMARLLGKVA